MQRIRTTEFGARVGRALRRVPAPIRELIGPVEFFEGDIVFAGHFSGRYSESLAELTARWYPPESPHYASYCAPWVFDHLPADQRCPQIDVSDASRRVQVLALVHELGHALQAACGSRWREPIRCVGLPALSPITGYKPDEYHEQFAEAFTIWLLPQISHRDAKAKGAERYANGPEILAEHNRELLAFFNGLAGWPADTLPVSLRG